MTQFCLCMLITRARISMQMHVFYKLVTLLKLRKCSCYDLMIPNSHIFSVHVCIFWHFGSKFMHNAYFEWALLILQPFGHFTYVTAHSPTISVALPTSQLILQSFRCFTFVIAHSPTLLSLLLPHRLFIYVTWRAAHGLQFCRKQVFHRKLKNQGCSFTRYWIGAVASHCFQHRLV